MGRWALFSTLMVAALPAGLVGYQLFVFITNYSGNARTLHQVIAYGAGVCALAMIGLTVASPALVPAGPGGAKAKGKKDADDEAAPMEAESFGDSQSRRAARPQTPSTTTASCNTKSNPPPAPGARRAACVAGSLPRTPMRTPGSRLSSGGH
jgi:hypothetical protein